VSLSQKALDKERNGRFLDSFLVLIKKGENLGHRAHGRVLWKTRVSSYHKLTEKPLVDGGEKKE